MKRHLLIILLMILMSLGAHATLLTDKEEYGVMEPIIVTAPEGTRVIIEAPDARYRLLEPPTEAQPFIPKLAGEYTVLLLDEEGNIVAEGDFIVVAKTQRTISVSDDPRIGDDVRITITPPPTGDVEVTISAPGGKFRYTGPWIDSPFQPKVTGQHEIIIQEQGVITGQLAFTVGEQLLISEIPDIDVPVIPVMELPKGVSQIKIRNSGGAEETPTIKFTTKNKGGKELHDLDINPRKRFAKRLVINDLQATPNIDIGLDEVPENSIRLNQRTLKSFAVNLEGFNFTNATLTSVAEGTELYKCAAWNFTMQRCDGTWIKYMDITPGEEYNITLFPGDPGYAETGVATINTKKSVYKPGEIADLIMVVLDTEGFLVGGANVRLTVVSPDNVTTILTTPNQITQLDLGIYTATYQTSIEGNYTLLVEASTLWMNSSMTSYFTVLQDYPFDIIRDTPATTDPFKGPFESSITIQPNIEVEQYDFTEILPAEFDIVTATGAVVSTDSNSQYLTWSNLSGKQTVYYKAQPPQISPNLYALGRAFITYMADDMLHIFEEFRVWFLAIDPDVTRDQGLVVYGDRTPDGSVKFRNWTGTLAGEQDSGLSMGNRHAWFRFRCSKLRYECLLMTSDAGNDINFAVFDTNTWLWRNSTELDNSVGHDDQMQFDVDCEDTSGDCLIVYEDDTGNNANFAYYTWNATGLSALQSATVTGGENDNFIWMELYPQKGTDRIGIAVMNDAGSNNGQTPAIYAGIWNGSAFYNWTILTLNGASQGTDRTFFKQFDCAWEGNASRFVCFFGQNGLAGVNASRWNGTNWSNVGVIYSATGSEILEFAACGQEPWSNFNHNDVGLMFCDDASDLDGGIWNGTNFSKAATTTTPGENTNAECGANKGTAEWGRNFECRWERAGTQAVFSWVAANGQDWITSGTYTQASRSWSMNNFTTGSQVSADTAGDIRMVQMVPNQGDDTMLMVYGDSSSDGGCTYWTGSSWDSANCNGGVAFETGGARPARQWITYDWFRTPPPQPEIEIYSPNGTINTYTYSGILSPSSSHRAWGGNSTVIPPASADAPALGTEFTSAAYVNISASDNARHGTTITNAPNGRRVFQHFNFSVPDSVASTTSIKFTHEGYATEQITQAADQFYIYFYNWTSDSYVLQRTVFPSAVDVITEVTVTTGFGDYVRDRSMLILVEGDFPLAAGAGARADILTDYVSLEVSTLATVRGNMTINATAVDDDGVGLCEWQLLNSSGNATPLRRMVAGGGTNFWYNITSTTTIADGTYNLTVYCNDTGSVRRNETERIRIDNTPPRITLYTPPNATNHTSSSFIFSWNTTDLAFTNMDCNLYLNQSAALTGVISAHAQNITRNVTGVYDGTRNWSVTCTDDAGNSNTSQIWYFDTDTIGPTISLSGPAAGVFTNNPIVNFTYVPSDNHTILNCSLRLNSVINATDFAILNAQTNNFTKNMSEGRHFWNITCTDAFRYTTNSTTRNLTVDVTKPVIFLNTTNGIVFNNTIPQLNYTAYDNLDTNLTCNITVDSTVVDANIPSGNNTLINRTVDLPDGIKFWNVTCWDDAGNTNTSLTRTFTIFGGPFVINHRPLDEQITNGTNVNFTYYVEDGDGLLNCSLYINNILNQTNTTPVNNNANNTFIASNLQEGRHSWYVECYDTTFTPGSDSPREVISDRTRPVITLNGPSAGQILTTTPALLNFTYTDLFSPNATCNITVDSSVAAGNLNFIAFNNTLSARSQTIINGIHYWNVTCIDVAGNSNISATRNFTVNVTFPLNVTVTTDKKLYVLTEIAVLNITTRNEAGTVVAANVTLDYIYTNNSFTDLPWWNISWGKRKPIYINETTGTGRADKMVAVNVTGLLGSISDCNAEIRIVGDDDLTERRFNILDGDDVSYCYVLFNATVTANAVNEQNYHVYYNNSGAAAPGYASLLAANILFSDDFEDAGTAGWTADAGWDRSTNDPISGNHAHIDGVVTNASIRPNQTWNIARFDQVNVSFVWALDGTFDAGEFLRIDLTNNSESSWTLDAGVLALNGAVSGNTMVNMTLNSSYKVDGFNIRFRSTTNDATEDGGFDNFSITGYYSIQTGLNTSAGEAQWWIERNTTATNSTGSILTRFNTTNRDTGNWSAAAYASNPSTANRAGWGGEWFRLETDRFGPNISLVSPANATTNFSGTIVFLYTAFDSPSFVQNCTLYINGVANQTNVSTINESGQNNFTISMGEGTYDWQVRCYDKAQNLGNSSTYTLWLDNTAPTVIAYIPNASVVSTNDVTFYFNATDNIDTSILCNLSVDNFAYSRTTNAVSAANTSLQILNISDGFHQWNVTCWDNINNTDFSRTLNFTIDAFPIVSLDSPPDGYGVNATNITLYYNLTESNLANCSLYINSAFNRTNSSPVLYTNNNGRNNFTLDPFPLGVYNWSVLCFDNSGFNGTSATWEFQLDDALPNLTLLGPDDNASIFTRRVEFNFTVNDSVDPILLCNLTLDGIVNVTLNATSGAQTKVNVTNLAVTSHLWNVTCWDNTGFTVTSETRDFTIIAITSVALQAPANGSVDGDGVINFTYIPNSIAGFLAGFCDLYVDGAVRNTHVAPAESVENKFEESGIAQGLHTWYVNCTDSSSVVNTSVTWQFFVDSADPVVTAHDPNGTLFTVSQVAFNWTPTDNLDLNLSCNVTVNGTVQTPANIASPNGTVSNQTYTGFGDGYHIWNASCLDDAGRRGTSTTLNFTIAEPPRILLGNPEDNNRSRNQTQLLFYTPSDNSGLLARCTLILDNLVNATNTSALVSGSQRNITVTNIPEGRHNWTYNCTDPHGNLGINATPKYFTIDISGPTINLSFPVNNSAVNANNITFNWTPIDLYSTPITCNITVTNGTTPLSSGQITQANGTVFNATISDLGDGPHNWSVTCVDDLGNIGISDTWTFNINQPDLDINNSDLSFNNTNPSEGENITIFANISNIGGIPATSVLVSFWDGPPVTGISIGNTTAASIVNNGSLVVNVSWVITPGYHNIWVAVDPDLTIGELNETNNNATINISYIKLNITSPLNNSITTDTTPSFTFNITDFTANNLTYHVFANGAYNGQTGNVTPGSSNTIDLNALGDGTHSIIFQATDSLGRSKNSTARIIRIDNTAPTVNFTTANNTFYRIENVTVYFNITDALSTALNFSVFLDGVFNQSNQTTSGAGANATFIGVSEGRHEVIVQATDEVSNTANSSILVIFVDFTPPVPNITTANNTWFNTSAPVIGINITDNLDSILNWSFFVDGHINTNGSANNATATTGTLAGLTEGNHTIILQAYDDAGNYRNSSPTRILIDLTAPNVTLISPLNDTNFTATNVLLNFTAADNFAVVMACTITLDGSAVQNLSLNNGTYGTYLATSLASGYHYWNATCYDNASNRGVSQTWQFFIQLPDLIITSGNITFNATNPIENDTVAVNATIYNVGQLNITTNFTVQFWLGDPDSGGSLISSHQVQGLNVSQNTTLNTTTNAIIGVNQIYVVVDPLTATNGSIMESNESNNRASRSFWVGLFQVFAGGTSSELKITDASIIAAYSWAQNDTNGSNIYVADTESSISFTSLTAIGVNITNGTLTGSNDFVEIDSRLNSSSLNDSVNLTFTISGSPRTLRNISAYRRTILNVPIVNSTNTTSFLTGIMWDAADGGGFYNGSQDIVFMTVMNQSQTGFFGNYDYEIKVPAKLRDYIAGGGTVTFYTELR